MKNRFNSGLSRLVPFGDPIGLMDRKLLHFTRLAQTVRQFIDSLYPPEYLSTNERNRLIRKKYAEGATLSELAIEYSISVQRVYQLVNLRNR